eukprot:5385170-Pleurochrysis_carterae.AAC.1
MPKKHLIWLGPGGTADHMPDHAPDHVAKGWTWGREKRDTGRRVWGKAATRSVSGGCAKTNVAQMLCCK